MYIGHGGWNCFVCFGFPCSVMAPIRGVTAMLIGRTDWKTVRINVDIHRDGDLKAILGLVKRG